MIEFIDKTSEKKGTSLNRSNMMALQGFEALTTTFSTNGSITETNAQNQKKTTTFNADGSITEKFVGEKTITKTITFTNNIIKEVLS